MSDTQLVSDPGYQALVERLSAVYNQGRIQAHRAVNEHLIQTFWQIGNDIVEFEQGGQTRATYGQALLTNLCRDLRHSHGKGFSRSNIIRARQFFFTYQKGATLPHLLSWSRNGGQRGTSATGGGIVKSHGEKLPRLVAKLKSHRLSPWERRVARLPSIANLRGLGYGG